MTKQELAKNLLGIDWLALQTGDPMWADNLDCLREELLNLPPDQALRVCLEVMEVKVLQTLYPGEDSPFKDMHEFKYLH